MDSARWLSRLAQDFVRSLVGGQQGFDPSPQLGIVAAGSVQVGRPARRPASWSRAAIKIAFTSFPGRSTIHLDLTGHFDPRPSMLRFHSGAPAEINFSDRPLAAKNLAGRSRLLHFF